MHQLPLITCLFEVIHEGAQVYLSSQRSKLGVTTAGLHHGQRSLAFGNVGAGVLDGDEMVAGGLAGDDHFVTLTRSQVGAQSEGTAASETA
ncbi:hypothetical protein AO269_31755 [Pseudomonas putida]|nr:hypothetical protein AO269_31755 [Pseudomonas putida]